MLGTVLSLGTKFYPARLMAGDGLRPSWRVRGRARRLKADDGASDVLELAFALLE